MHELQSPATNGEEDRGCQTIGQKPLVQSPAIPVSLCILIY
jgi:hypothetical protein